MFPTTYWIYCGRVKRNPTAGSLRVVTWSQGIPLAYTLELADDLVNDTKWQIVKPRSSASTSSSPKSMGWTLISFTSDPRTRTRSRW